MLTGDLGEFAAHDVLALVARAGATGALVLEGATEARIYCAGGAVTYAATDATTSLADVLVATRFLQPDQWAEAAEDDDPATAVAKALAANGADPARLAAVLQGRTEEAVFELDLWQHGRFAFEAGADHLLGDAFRFAIGDVLAAVEDRRRRWDDLVVRFGSIDHVVAPEATGDLGEADDELVLNRTQFRLLAIAARHLPVAGLARELDLGLFATGELVAGLVDQGLLAVHEPATAPFTSPVAFGDAPLLAPVLAGVGAAEAAYAAAPALAHRNGGGHDTSGFDGGTFDGAGDFGIDFGGTPSNGAPHGPDGADGHAPADASGLPGAEFVAPGDAPARDLILRLLTAVKEL